MKRIILATVAAGTLTLASAGLATAASPNQGAPGVPGDKNCVGQTTSWLAQLGSGADITGIGNLADAFSLSTKDLKAAIKAYCGA